MDKKVKQMGLTKFNNAEHLAFHLDVARFIEKCTAENISCTKELPLYKSAIELEVEIINRQTASSITEELENKDKERDGLISYLFGSINNAKNSPIDTQRASYKTLSFVIAPYQGISQKTHSQESADIITLVKELRKEIYLECLAELYLTDVVNLIAQKNNEYIALYQQRTSKTPNKRDTVNVRAKVDEIYELLIDKINGTVVLVPNDSAKTLVINLNNLIDKTTASYNLRKAKRATEDDTSTEKEVLSEHK